MSVKHEITTVFTKVLLTVGTIGMGYEMLRDVELIFSIVLKFVSIISFLIVIIINYPKLKIRLKDYFRNNI